MAVTNTIKEYSDDFTNLYNYNKYVVEQNESDICIRYMSYDNKKKLWNEDNSMNINIDIAKILFNDIAECLNRGEFTEDY